jgi:CRP-like cAMP-binding protein
MTGQVSVDIARGDCAGAIWPGPLQDYPKGAELFHQGQPVRDVFYIAAGMVKLACTGADGRESILGLALPGQWLGLAPVIAGRPAPVSAHTCSPVVVKRMSAHAFRRRLEDDPAWSREVHRQHANELCEQMRWIGQLGTASARERLCRVLRHLIAALQIKKSAHGVRFAVPLHQWELARLLAITPEHLCRLVRELETDGLIRRDKGMLVVPDVHDLWPDDGDAAWRPHDYH